MNPNPFPISLDSLATHSDVLELAPQVEQQGRPHFTTEPERSTRQVTVQHLVVLIRQMTPPQQQIMASRLRSAIHASQGRQLSPEVLTSLFNDIIDTLKANRVRDQADSAASDDAEKRSVCPIELHAHIKVRTPKGTHRLLVKASAEAPHDVVCPPARAAPLTFPSVTMHMGNPLSAHTSFHNSPWPAAQDSTHPWLPRVSLAQVQASLSTKLGLSPDHYTLTYADREDEAIQIATEDDWSEAVWTAIHYAPPTKAPRGAGIELIGALNAFPAGLGPTDAGSSAQRLTQYLSGTTLMGNSTCPNAKSLFVSSFALTLTLHPKSASLRTTPGEPVVKEQE